MLFWILALVLSVIAAGIMMLPVLRGMAPRRDTSRSDMAVYRDQLQELDAEIARGTVTPEAAEASRIEISRRLLAAEDGQNGASGAAPRTVSVGAGTALLFVATAASLALYAWFGRPGEADQPLALRGLGAPAISQAEAEAAAEVSVAAEAVEPGERDAALLAQLEETLAAKPEVEGFRILSGALASLGRYKDALTAQERAIALADPPTLTDLSRRAELMIFTAGGRISTEARAALGAVLEVAPNDPKAGYYRGLAYAEDGRPDLSIEIWADLLEKAPPDADWAPPMRMQILALARETGLPLPRSVRGVETRGPDAADIEAAGEMSAGDRQEMIEGMVAGLAERLAEEGGPPEEWAQLIRALTVLGDEARARAILAEARTAFAGDEAGRALIARTATEVGLE